MDTRMTRRGAVALGGGLLDMALGLHGAAATQITPVVLGGVLVASRSGGREVSNSKIQIELRSDGSAEFRVYRWVSDHVKFGEEEGVYSPNADVRAVPISRETFAAIEAALYDPATGGGSA